MGGRNSRAEGCADTSSEGLEDAHGGGPPCPVVFDPDDVYETMKLDAEQREADESLGACRDVIGFGPEGLGARRALRGGHGTQQEAEGG